MRQSMVTGLYASSRPATASRRRALTSSFASRNVEAGAQLCVPCGTSDDRAVRMIPLRNAHKFPYIVDRKICISYSASRDARAYFILVFTRVLAISRTRVPCRRRVLCPTGWARLGIEQMEDPRRPQPTHLSHPEQIATESAAHECCKCNAP